MLEQPTPDLPTDERIVAALILGGRTLALDDLTSTTNLSKPALHYHLQRLIAAGRVEKHGRHPNVTYMVRPRTTFDWVQPGRPAKSGEFPWFEASWTTSATVDWRFPLAYRIPDPMGRNAALAFLRAMWDRGWFTPWLVHGATTSAIRTDWPKERKQEMVLQLSDPRHHGPVSIFAYGSCVRGDAREESDLDLLAIVPGQDAARAQPPWKSMLGDLADELNLAAARTIDLVVLERSDVWDWLMDRPPWLRKSIRKEAITIFSTHPNGEYAEYLRAARIDD